MIEREPSEKIIVGGLVGEESLPLSLTPEQQKKLKLRVLMCGRPVLRTGPAGLPENWQHWPKLAHSLNSLSHDEHRKGLVRE
jgi:hypothetical protein